MLYQTMQQFRPCEKARLSTNSYTFIMTHREEVAHYVERLEMEKERREREAYRKRVIEMMERRMRKKKSEDVFYFEDIY